DELRTMLASPHVSAEPTSPGYPYVNAGLQARQTQVRALIHMDDPDHARHRRLLAPDFAPRRVESMRPYVQQIADALVDRMVAGPNPTDLVEAFALPFPSLVICELLGVPYEDRDFFHRVSSTLLSRMASADEAVAVTHELFGYMLSLLDRRVAEPTDD